MKWLHKKPPFPLFVEKRTIASMSALVLDASAVSSTLRASLRLRLARAASTSAFSFADSRSARTLSRRASLISVSRGRLPLLAASAASSSLAKVFWSFSTGSSDLAAASARVDIALWCSFASDSSRASRVACVRRSALARIETPCACFCASLVDLRIPLSRLRAAVMRALTSAVRCAAASRSTSIAASALA